MYAVTLDAIRSFDLVYIAVFGVGAASGLMCFSRLLDWLLSRFRGATIATLTGFLFGSLAVVWPWKRTLSWVTGRDGEPRAAQQWPVLPADYASEPNRKPVRVARVAPRKRDSSQSSRRLKHISPEAAPTANTAM